MTHPANSIPWARDLSEGDIITADQAACIDKTRLRDFGLELRRRRDGRFRVVTR